MPTDPRQQPVDVTAMYGREVVLPQRDIVDMDPNAMRDAENTTYLGENTDAESKELVNRHFTVTRGTDYRLHLIADDPRFGYRGKASGVVRHAVELLLAYYEANAPMLDQERGFANEVRRTQEELRLAAHRARVRKEFRESIAAFDEEMAEAIKIGDYAYIANQLSKYSAMLKGCSSAAQKNVLAETIARSMEAKTAVSKFYDFVMSPNAVRPPEWDAEKWQTLATTWNTFFEETF